MSPTFGDLECSETRTNKNQIYKGKQTCQTTDDCELVYSHCSYVAMTTKNSIVYKTLRKKEYEVCPDQTLAVCLESTPKEALCINYSCQTVESIDINDEIKTTMTDLKKATNQSS